MSARDAVRRAGPALLLGVAALTPACASDSSDLDFQRKRDEEFVATSSAELFHEQPNAFAAVQAGRAAGAGPTADDAARLAAAAAPEGTLHRFVFRSADAGDRLHRLAFLPAGGLVAGRRFLADLGFRVVSVGAAGAGRKLVLDHRGARRTIDLAAQPRLRIELGPLAGTPELPLDVPLDPNFDGPLLLPAEAAEELGLELAEIPGHAEVQVAIGRPFDARRAWVAARCPDLGEADVVEVLVPAPGPGARR